MAEEYKAVASQLTEASRSQLERLVADVHLYRRALACFYDFHVHGAPTIFNLADFELAKKLGRSCYITAKTTAKGKADVN